MHRSFFRYMAVLFVLVLQTATEQPKPRVAQAQNSFGDAKSRVDRRHPVLSGPAKPGDQTSKPARSTAPGNWSKIAFQAFWTGNWEIYLADGFGNNAANITNHPAGDFEPRLDRGAARLAFTSNRDGNEEIYAMLANGAYPTRLTSAMADDFSPDWSPQGDRIVFVSERDGNAEIYVMNADGSGQIRLTNDNDPDSNPTWSPDGQRIAWVRSQADKGTIWVMDANGGNSQQVTNPQSYMGKVAWTLDGSGLVCDFDFDGDVWNEIVLVSDQSMQVLADAGGYASFTDLWAGSVSPDGQWVIFSRIEYSLSGNQLYIKNTYLEMVQLVNSDNPIRLPGVGYENHPDWETADILAPTSQVPSLPSRSRRGGFQVSWKGSDNGPAGITSYELQYRLGEQGSWADWYLTYPLSLSAIFPFGNPGDRVFFRSRARDAAGNVEAWPINPQGDASTLLYQWRVAGNVTDNRGAPIPGVQLQVNPSALDISNSVTDGAYMAWLGAESQHALQATRAGYNSFPPANLALNADAILDFYLPPQGNLIMNGGFEDQLNGWQISGTAVLTQAIGSAHTGELGLMLAQPCPAPCLSTPDPTPVSSSAEVDIISLQDDTLVVIYSEPTTNPSGLYAIRLPPGGAWSSPVLIGTFPFSASGTHPALAVDNQDHLHTVWMGSDGLYYSHQPAQGSWSLPELIAPGQYPDLAVDQQGGVHLVYSNGDVINYQGRLLDGTWSAPLRLDNGSGYMLPGITASPDGIVHFIWQEIHPNGESGVFTRARLPSGALTTTTRLSSGSGYSYYPQKIALGPTGELHAFWVWGHDGYYTYRPPGEDWLPVTAITSGYGPADIMVDNQGTLHMLGYDIATSGYYRSKSPASGWTDPLFFFPVYTKSAFTVDSQGRLHMLTRNTSISKWEYRSRLLANQSRLITTSQSLTISADSHQPTLSFFYALDQMLPGGESFFQASIQDDLKDTPIFTTTTKTSWVQAWADLSSWAGETITLTYSLYQAAGEPEVQLSLDDISLGAWLTPLIWQVTPNKIVQDWTGQVLTISGVNFIPGATVSLDEFPLNSVQWIDQGTLQASLPAGFSPGVYDLWVVNPGQQRAVLVQGFTLGNILYLPAIYR